MPDPTPTPDNILTALQQTHWALARAADHIRSREGHSAAYRDAARARDATHDALVRAARAPHALPSTITHRLRNSQ